MKSWGSDCLVLETSDDLVKFKEKSGHRKAKISEENITKRREFIRRLNDSILNQEFLSKFELLKTVLFT